jgi:hypothetical protein
MTLQEILYCFIAMQFITDVGIFLILFDLDKRKKDKYE